MRVSFPFPVRDTSASVLRDIIRQRQSPAQASGCCSRAWSDGHSGETLNIWIIIALDGKLGSVCNKSFSDVTNFNEIGDVKQNKYFLRRG